MGVLDKIMEMKSQGMNDVQIVEALKQEKFSPKEINDALNQVTIKKAASNENEDFGFDGMEPSIMQQQDDLIEIPVPQPIGKPYVQKTKEINGTSYQQPRVQQKFQQQYPQAQQSYSPQYGQYSQQYPEQNQEYHDDLDYSSNTDTLIEISEQVFDEKISQINEQIESTNKFRAITEAKLEGFEERLRKIESVIDKLQISILEKVGSYGRNVEMLKREMETMNDSLGKAIPSIIEKKPRIEPEKYSQEIPEEEAREVLSDIDSIAKSKKKFSKKR